MSKGLRTAVIAFILFGSLLYAAHSIDLLGLVRILHGR